MTTFLRILTLLGASAASSLAADPPIVRLVRLDATPEAIAKAFPTSPDRPSIKSADIESMREAAIRTGVPILSGVFTQSDTAAILTALGERARTVAMPKESFTATAVREATTPESTRLTVTRGGNATVVSLWKHQAAMITIADGTSATGIRLYLLRLE